MHESNPMGMEAAIEIAPVVAVATTTAAFAATVVNHRQVAPPAHPSTAPRQVKHTAQMVGRLSKRTITAMKSGERAGHVVLDVTHDMSSGPIAHHVLHATSPTAHLRSKLLCRPCSLQRSKGKVVRDEPRYTVRALPLLRGSIPQLSEGPRRPRRETSRLRRVLPQKPEQTSPQHHDHALHK